jgi:hypothetical protein
MPNIRTFGQYRFFFSSSDGSEPPHVHVEHNGQVAKFWLDPIKRARSGRLPEHRLAAIERLIIEHQVELIEAWHDYFAN